MSFFEFIRIFKAPFVLVLGAPKSTDHDGYSRRIEAVDEYLKPEKLVYVFPNSDTFRGHFSSYHSSPYLRLNGRNPLHHFLFLALLIRAKAVYSHSIFGVYRKLTRVWLSLIPKKIIVDVHGVVPEETRAQGSAEMADLLEQVESWIFRRTSVFVVVTNKMKNHILKKHSDLSDKQFLLLPIVTPLSESPDLLKNQKLVVYSGGMQQWQRVDLMVNTIRSQPDFSYQILTPDREKFELALPTSKFPNVQITYLEGLAYSRSIQQATFGFMLRKKDIINEVACPTKLYDYLALGVIPIVEYAGIGDFEELKYVSISTEDFLSKPEFEKEFLLRAQQINKEAASNLYQKTKDSIDTLKSILKSY